MNNLSVNGQNKLGNITSNVQNNITNMPEIIKQNFNNAAQVVDNNYNQVKNNVTNGLNKFSEQINVGTGATQQFLSSNTIIAKFAFVILVIILFLFFLTLGIKFIAYLLTPKSNPFIVSGIASASIVSTDPGVANSVPILRSNNEKTGLEFTWSFWLLVTDISERSTYIHIFNKGSKPQTAGTMASTNGPGVYLNPNNDGTSSDSLTIMMDSTDDTDVSINVDSIPLNKWFHVAIRAENTIFDVYINGTLKQRQIFSSVPKQNYYDINILQDNFNGRLSNLQYFSSALSVIQINNIVFWGPNLLESGISNYSSTDYLSAAWYTTGNNPPQI
jgi:hypothetical protein